MAKEENGHGLRISTRSRYAVRILFDLATHRGTLRSLREIAADRRLSRGYIARLMLRLRQAGLVDSAQGPAGGFRLVRHPRSISFLEVIDVMDGPLTVVPCASQPDLCQHRPTCRGFPLWSSANEAVRGVFRNITIQTMLDTSGSVDVSSDVLCVSGRAYGVEPLAKAPQPAKREAKKKVKPTGKTEKRAKKSLSKRS